MKNLLKVLVCLCLSLPVFGQMTVTGSNLADASGNAISNATISFAPALANGNPASYRKGTSGGQVIIRPISATVTSGAFTVSLPDTSQTNPANVCFVATVTDNQTGDSLLGPGYGCVQPSPAATWCSGTTCNFDAFPPNLAGLAVSVAGPTGPTGPAGPTGPTGPSGASTISASPQFTLPFFSGAGSTQQLGGSNITTDSTGNNLIVPKAISALTESLPGTDATAGILSTLTIPGTNPFDVLVQGRIALIGSKDTSLSHGYLSTVDISSPASPVLLGTATTDSVGTEPAGMVILGNIAYVAFFDTCKVGLYSLVNTSGIPPAMIGSISLRCASGEALFGLAAQGDELYATTILTTGTQAHIIAVNINRNTIDSSFAVAANYNVDDIIVEYPFAYASLAGSGTGLIDVFNIANPAAITSVSSAVTDHSPQRIVKQDQLIYASILDASEVQTFSVKNPDAISLVATTSVTSGCSPLPVVVQDQRLYVGCDAAANVALLSLATPTAPTLIGHVSGTIPSQDLRVHGQYGLSFGAAGSVNTLSVIDFGGLYLQNLEVGNIEATQLDLRGHLTALDAFLRNGLYVGGDIGVFGNVSATKFNGSAAGLTNYPIATSSAPGVVQPDNTTITINNGLLSAMGGGGGGGTGNGATYKEAAICSAGSATSVTLAVPPINAPALGCVSPTDNAMGYADFAPSAVSPQFIYGVHLLPVGWNADDLTIAFYAGATSGTIIFSVQTGCVDANSPATPITYGTAVSVTTNVSSTTNGVSTTATLSNIAQSGTNGCAAGAIMHYRISRSSIDTLSGEAFMLGATLTSR